MSQAKVRAMAEAYRSRVYTDRPEYADFDAPHKFQAIQGIVARRLKEHPKAICSYSGGSDSDILIDLVERTRQIFKLPPVKYVFFNTGLEMTATKNHVAATAEKYGVEIETVRPKISIVTATKRHGIPFMSKHVSEGLEEWQKKNIPMTITDEYIEAEDKEAKYAELKERYPKSVRLIQFLCSCGRNGEPMPGNKISIDKARYLRDFIMENPPEFKISAKCCDYCKKQPAHTAQKGYDMVITGERKDEGGRRAIGEKNHGCFIETADNKYRLRPLFFASNADKAWYKDYYGIRYSDAYEVYGLTRTGCCGCSISYKAVDDLERIKPYEPNLVKAAWSVFGASYLYRQEYNAYKVRRDADSKGQCKGQTTLWEG